MAYSDKVIDHYEKKTPPPPQRWYFRQKRRVRRHRHGRRAACGDVMRLQIKVNDEGIIEDAKFKTYGCGSAIASSSLITEWVKGKALTMHWQSKTAKLPKSWNCLQLKSTVPF